MVKNCSDGSLFCYSENTDACFLCAENTGCGIIKYNIKSQEVLYD